MEKKNKSSVDKRDWKDMSYDVLIKIFMTLNVVDFAAVSMVCSSWRNVCQDPAFWDGNVFDLTKWKQPPVSNLTSRVVGLLITFLHLSNGQAHRLIFQFQMYLDNRALYNVAKRSRNLKRVVLPGWVPDITKEGIDQAMEQWGGLESMTITSNYTAHHFIEAIGKYCPNFSQLKLTCHLTLRIATTLAKHVPKLKVLSVQSIRMNKNALVYLVKNLNELEVLNVTHGFVISGNRPGNTETYPQPAVPKLLENMPRKPTLMHCKGFCVTCQEVFVCNMLNKWRNPKQHIWRNDEIPSLQV